MQRTERTKMTQTEERDLLKKQQQNQPFSTIGTEEKDIKLKDSKRAVVYTLEIPPGWKT